MKNIKIEKFNLLNKKGIGWIVILGLIPVFGLIYILLFIVPSGRFFDVKLKRTPMFIISNNKNLGNAKLWGIIFLLLAVVQTILLILFFNYTFLNLMFPFSNLVMGFYLITYNIRYNNYIQYINSFFNDVMIKNQRDNNFNSNIILKKEEKIEERLKIMLADLKHNNIINIQNGKDPDEKIIFFTPEFQQVLLSML